jgi:multisubunit Na+/H+ antiporter MnhG subunit
MKDNSNNNKRLGIFPRTISKKQATDTGMAFVLVLLLIGLFTHNDLYYKLSIPVLIITMTIPMVYYPLAIIWLGFSQLLGDIVSKIVLTIIYILVVLPIGLIRRLMGKDSLQLSGFKKAKSSVMKTRNHEFTSKDIENPY